MEAAADRINATPVTYDQEAMGALTLEAQAHAKAGKLNAAAIQALIDRAKAIAPPDVAEDFADYLRSL